MLWQKFNAAASATLSDKTNVNFVLSFNAVSEHVFPRKALQHQRQCMQRHLWKPGDTSICTFVASLSEINKHSPEFPPFADNQKLPETDILEIVEFAIPGSWQREMIKQGFNPTDQSTTEIVEF